MCFFMRHSSIFRLTWHDRLQSQILRHTYFKSCARKSKSNERTQNESVAEFCRNGMTGQCFDTLTGQLDIKDLSE